MSKKLHVIFLLASVALVFLLSYCSDCRIMYTVSDPKFGLLVSQEMIQHKTIRLDRYQNASWMKHDYRIVTSGGHYYYFYPLGTPVLSVPAVWLANRFGMDMIDYEDDIALQHVLAAGACGLILILLYAIGRFFVGPWASLVISLAGILGTSIISSAGAALWSFDYALVFVLTALWLALRLENGRARSWEAYPLGVVLFLSYFCRPASAIVIVLMFIYLAVLNWKYCAKVAGVSLVCLLGFLMFNWFEFGRALPHYYGMSVFHHTGRVGKNLFGLLVSPSRGLFVFSPVFLVVLGCGLVLFKKIKPRLLFALCLAWPVILAVILADRVQWYGGHGFGPRLLTDAVPAFIVLNFMAAREVLALKSRAVRVVLITLFAAAAVFSIFVHTGQGLFNHHTAGWNQMVDIDKNPDVNFDWRWAQWRASKDMAGAWYQAHGGGVE